MMKKNGTTIWLSSEERRLLNAKKREYEVQSGQRMDWGKFLLLLAGLYALSQVGKDSKQRGDAEVMRLQQEHNTIPVTKTELEVLSKAKEGYQQNQGKEVDWGQFLIILAGLWALNEVTKPKVEKVP